MKNLPIQRRDDDKGFTLIELMVVVLIIAILLAIAIPTFLGAQNKAKDRSAQSSARNALTNAKTIYADGGVYAKGATDTVADNSAVAVTNLTASEPALTFQTADSTAPKIVSVSVAVAGQQFYAAVLSDTKTCFYIADNVGAAIGAPVTVPQGTSYFKVANAATCKAEAAHTYTISGW
jgi:type IV pilus assembly protein PilA